MKEWFKYEFGFVNIDDNNIYLTNTGNWSEIHSLEEKSMRLDRKNDTKGSMMIGFILVFLALFGFLIFKNLMSGKVGFFLIAIVALGGYKLYDYLKTEIGAQFKIPKSKITEIKIGKESAEILFLNADEKSDSYKLLRIDKKGIEILTELNKTYV